jgi:hypothetical protein
MSSINSLGADRVKVKFRWLVFFFGLLEACSNERGDVSEATLFNLELSTGILTPNFDPRQTQYSVEETYLTDTILLTPTAKNRRATIVVNGEPVLSGLASQAIPLSVGVNPLTVEVTAPDGRLTRYDVIVFRSPSNDYLKALNPHLNDQFGGTVSIDGDTLAVGAVNESSNATGGYDPNDTSTLPSGAVYVFVRSGSNWVQQAYLKAPNPTIDDFFGSSVSVSGDTLAVGADGENTDRGPLIGGVYVFTRSEGVWTRAAHIQPADLENGAFFGASVSLSGETLAVGAYGGGQMRGGAVYLFTGSGADWTQEARLEASNPNTQDLFGFAISLYGDTLAVGALLEDSDTTGVDGDQGGNGAPDSGAVYIFTRAEHHWTQQAYLKASNTNRGDHFGVSVSLSGDTLAVGAHREDSNSIGIDGDQTDVHAPYSGAVYVFTRSGTAWRQQAYLKASNTDPGDNFGLTVSLDGNALAVGAPFEDSNATEIEGINDDDRSQDSGAVYLFLRAGETWRQQALLKASNPLGGGQFGFSVFLSGDHLAVGAVGEDSNATGVNGNQADRSLEDSGAVYLYETQ